MPSPSNPPPFRIAIVGRICGGQISRHEAFWRRRSVGIGGADFRQYSGGQRAPTRLTPRPISPRAGAEHKKPEAQLLHHAFLTATLAGMVGQLILLSMPASSSESVEFSRSELRQFFRGTVGIAEDSTGLIPLRLDPAREEFYHPGVRSKAQMTAGVHLKFQSAATGFILEFDLAYFRENQSFEFGAAPVSERRPADATMEVFVNGQRAEARTSSYEGLERLELHEFPAEEKEIVIYFPLHAMVRVRRLALDGRAAASAVPQRPRWITHGSSITHCRNAESPGMTWPAIVARQMGWDAWNLGFGGQCKFDQIVARSIAKMPAERISLCLGINTCADFYQLRTWIPAVEGFIFTVRDGHPETPLLIISPILSPPREEFDKAPTTIGLKTMRQILEEAVAKFARAGDRNIYYLDGTKIIGPGDESTMPDQLHPDAEGIKLMARRFVDHTPGGWKTAP